MIPPGSRSPRPVYVAVTRAFGSTDPSVPVITEHLALISFFFFCNFFFLKVVKWEAAGVPKLSYSFCQLSLHLPERKQTNKKDSVPKPTTLVPKSVSLDLGRGERGVSGSLTTGVSPLIKQLLTAPSLVVQGALAKCHQAPNERKRNEPRPHLQDTDTSTRVAGMAALSWFKSPMPAALV